MRKMTEDEVRSKAGGILGFTTTRPDNTVINIENSECVSGVGQLTTFNQLGKRLGVTDFSSINDKPDGWYFPFNVNEPAIVLETKSEKENIYQQKWEDEIKKNIEITKKRYEKVAGILYNGKDTRVYINFDECTSASKSLQKQDYYKRLFIPDTIDTGKYMT